MVQAIVTFKEVYEFGVENGYIFALYELKEDNRYHLKDKEVFFDCESPFSDTLFVCDGIGSGLNLNEVISLNEVYMLKLHNTYNLPEIIEHSQN